MFSSGARRDYSLDQRTSQFQRQPNGTPAQQLTDDSYPLQADDEPQAPTLRPFPFSLRVMSWKEPLSLVDIRGVLMLASIVESGGERD